MATTQVQSRSTFLQRLRSLLKVNPIVVKEIRSRMRGPRAFLTLTAILVLLGLVMYAMLQLILATSRYTNVLSPQVGQYLFASLVFLELGVISIITPAVTAGAISGEREHETYEMLIATPMPPSAIVLGKLISALSYVLLLLFAAIPLASIVFIFGGVALREMVKALVVLLVVAVTYGILGIFLSALLRRTGRATIASFLIVGGLTMGPLFLTLLVAALRNGQPPRWLLAPSPISALSAAIAPSMQQMGGNELFYILGGIFNLGVTQFSTNSIPRPMYHYTLPLYGLLALVLYLATTRLVRPSRTWRMRRRDALLGAGAVILAVGAVVAAFLLTANRYEWAVQQNNPFAGKAMAEPAIAGPVFPPEIVAEERVVVESEATAEFDSLTNDDTTQILSAVARQLYLVEVDSSGWQGLYLINSAGYPKEILSGVATSLSSTKVMWVDSIDEQTMDPETGILDGGNSVYITFDSITVLVDEDEPAVEASATLHISNEEYQSEIYRLEKQNDVWQIVNP